MTRLNGINKQDMSAKERASTNLQERERNNYEGQKIASKKSMMWVYIAIAFVLAGFVSIIL